MNLPEYTPQWYVWLIAAFLPFVENFIIQKEWKSVFKFLTAFGISVVVALGAVWLGGKWDVANIAANISVVFVVAQGFYDSVWKEILK
ncbi:MAG: hypothetical protein GX452_13820 [Ignavibacteriales bacterium]|nr:hypothetical protein [Ignavibacteriales bacterium]